MDKEQINNETEAIQEKKTRRVDATQKKGLNKGLIITAIVLSVIAIVIVVFAIINKLNTNVYSNVYINGVNVSGKTSEELSSVIASLNEEFEKRTVSMNYNDKNIMELRPDIIEMKIDEEMTIKKIMAFGRENNIVVNNIEILKAMFAGHNIEPVYQYSEIKLINIATEITAGVEGRVKDDSYTVDEEKYNLIITKGTKGKDIIVTDFKADVLDILQDSSITEYNLILEERQPKDLDIDVVFADVCKEAKDAYVDKTASPFIYYKHEMGITFDKDELRNLLTKEENQEQGKIIEFKLTVKEPEVKIQDLTKDAYNDNLGSYTSNYINSDSNRASNVVLGAKLLNGTVVMPGETFSFNKVMGDCGLSSRGFKSAAVFKAGKVVSEIGGGICQISSTLYCAALYANLEIVSRSNHALPVGYVPVSLDATIYFPNLDFKFKNTRNYPIKIVATTTSSRKLTIAIYGTKEDKEYEVELKSYVTQTIAPKIQEQKDNTLEVGKTKVISDGANGYKSVAYKIVKYNGKIISNTLLSQDSYGSTPKIIAVGTKETAPIVKPQEPEPETPTPPPSSGTETPQEPEVPNEGTQTPQEPSAPPAGNNTDGGQTNN